MSNPTIPPLKDVKRMSENLAKLLKMIVEIVQNHGDRLKTLEENESIEDSDDAELMEAATTLLAKLQTPESGFAMGGVPSDQV
jgi:hypothetical protein